jgi:26S proteasome regulatory subunit N5
LDLNLKVQLAMVGLCYERSDFTVLMETMTVLSKKRSVVKQAIAGMIQKCMEYADGLGRMELKLKLIDTIRAVTDGKIYVEVERARTTRSLAAIKEASGNLAEAAEVMQELQVETFGSMEKRERLEFILEQLRLLVAMREWAKAQIVSRKIQAKVFETHGDFEDLRVRYLALMAVLHLQDPKRYLEASTCHLEMARSSATAASDSLGHLKAALLLAVLARHCPEQVQQLHVLSGERRFEAEAPLFRQLLGLFLAAELVRWPAVEAFFGAELKASSLFTAPERIGHLRDRIVEHNIRVVAKVYARLSLARLAALLELDPAAAEQMLCSAVVEGMVGARIDRPAGVVDFAARQPAEALLNTWAAKTDALLALMVRTNHLMAKEEMLGAIHAQR